MEEDMEIQRYLDMGAITIEGMDESGEIIYAIHDVAKEIAPELWEAHIRYVDDSLLELYKAGLIKVEYDENLEAMLHLSPEGYKMAKQMGLIQRDMPNPPNN